MPLNPEENLVGETSRAKVWKHPVVLTEHVFDKLWLLDIVLGEVVELLNRDAEVIEETSPNDEELKELVLNLQWTRPLHVVVGRVQPVIATTTRRSGW